jgi:hypothetical protein
MLTRRKLLDLAARGLIAAGPARAMLPLAAAAEEPGSAEVVAV